MLHLLYILLPRCTPPPPFFFFFFLFSYHCFVSPLTDSSTYFLCQLTQEHLGVRDGRYVYMQSLHLLSRPSPFQPTATPSWPAVMTPIHLPVLAHNLQSHPDREFVAFIMEGLTNGFFIGYSQGTGLRSASHNHPSSLANTGIVDGYIQEEVAARRMLVLILLPLVDAIHCSPIGLVPKGRATGQWRMIVDLSYPEGRSVNDGIPSSPCSVSYPSVDEALT